MTPGSNRSSLHTPQRGNATLRIVALTAALCVGGVLTYAATARPALAAALTDTVQGSPWFAHMHGDHAAMHDHFEQVLARAGTSDAQRSQIDAIVKQAMEAQHADMARFHTGLGRIKSLLAAPRIDQAAIEAVRSQQDQILLDSDRRFTETLLRIAQVLTPAQRQALSADIDGMMAKHIGHHPAH